MCTNIWYIWSRYIIHIANMVFVVEVNEKDCQHLHAICWRLKRQHIYCQGHGKLRQLTDVSDVVQAKHERSYCTCIYVIWEDVALASACWWQCIALYLVGCFEMTISFGANVVHVDVISRHCCHRSSEPRSPRRKQQAAVANREWWRKPEAEYCTRPRDRRLLRHSPLRPSQWSIWGWSQPVGRGGLCRVWVSDTVMGKILERSYKL